MHTLKDVAKEAGVTVTTVSRVINDRGYIADKTRKKVYAAMKKLDYQPNELARSLILRYSSTIGIIVPSTIHPFFGALVQSLEYEASLRGYKVMLCNSNHDVQKEIAYVEMLKRNKADGIIMASRTEEVKHITSLAMPVLTIDRKVSANIPYITSDNDQGGVLATQHLIAQGCKNLVFIGGSPDLHQLANQRGTAFLRTCQTAGVSAAVIDTEEKSFSSLHYEKIISDILTSYPETDGIFASSDVIAAQVIKSCKAAGKKIPEHIKVVGYDDTIIASLMEPGITTVRQPVDQIAFYAVDLLIRRIKKELSPNQIILPVSLEIRQST